MTYVCEDCGFLFCRAGEVKECASCDKSHIRPATKANPVKAGDAKLKI